MKLRLQCHRIKKSSKGYSYMQHLWQCTCKENFWETEEAKTNAKYQEYLVWKSNQSK